MGYINQYISYTFALLLVLLWLPSGSNALTLQQVEQAAVTSDPAINKFVAASRAFEEAAIAGGSLPDPRLRLGAVNVPVDTFDLQQEQMTQLKLGIVQNFPRGDSRSLQQKYSQFLSRSAHSQADNEKLVILRDARINFLNLYYEVTANQIILETRKLFYELLNITESNYAAGRVNQQDVVMAGLEMSRLDDRAAKILTQQEIYQARLSKWIGELAWTEVDRKFPLLPEVPAAVDLNTVIPQHPLIQAKSETILASKQQTEIAKQDYSPGWSLLLDYGYRAGNNPDGSERADFATAMVSLDVPLFTSNRQDRSVASSRQNEMKAQFERDDKLRLLKQIYDENQRKWQRLSERKALYEASLLTAAKNNSTAALNAYQSGVTEFNTLMRAQITELDVKLEDLRIRVDLAIAKSNLLYVIGDIQ